jgi:hypothetical protein
MTVLHRIKTFHFMFSTDKHLYTIDGKTYLDSTHKWYFFTASSHFIYPTSDLSFFFFHRLKVKFDPIVAAFWIVKPGQLNYSDISRYINGLFNYDTVKLDFIKKYLWVLSRYVLPSIVYKCLSVENIKWNVLILWRTVIGWERDYVIYWNICSLVFSSNTIRKRS